MAALNFPPEPIGQNTGTTYTGSNGVAYVWDGYKWVGHSPVLTPGTNSISNNGNVVQVDQSGNLVIPDGKTILYAGGGSPITGGNVGTSWNLTSQGNGCPINVTLTTTTFDVQVPRNHLFFNEEDLNDYNTLLKVFPPLRTKLDQAALLKSVEEGIVDCISSHHIPQDWDGKTIEFENAKAGIACIETSYASVKQVLPNLADEKIAALFSTNARSIFNLPANSIVEGGDAELTLFTDKQNTCLSKKDSKSKSANSPFWDIELKGKVIGTYTKGKLNINN